MISQEIQTIIAKEPYFFVIFQGVESPDPMSPSEFAYAIQDYSGFLFSLFVVFIYLSSSLPKEKLVFLCRQNLAGSSGSFNLEVSTRG